MFTLPVGFDLFTFVTYGMDEPSFLASCIVLSCIGLGVLESDMRCADIFVP